jgi:hypothetical protein
MNASPMPWPRTGEKLPLVTCADRSAVDEHFAVRARRSATLGGDSHELAGHAGVALGLQGLTAAEIALRPSHDPSEAGLQAGDPGPSSWPCNGSAASSRKVSRAPRPAGVTPAAVMADHRSAAPALGTAISTPASPV